MPNSDKNDLLKTFKHLLITLLDSAKLTTVVRGTVESIDPVTVRLNAKVVIKEPLLVIPEAFQDHDIHLEYNSVEKYKVKYTIKPRDNLLLIRNYGGNEYIILSKVVN
ncbi:MAG: DUF2577 family protein [Filifactoraceae bacterium]